MSDTYNANTVMSYTSSLWRFIINHMSSKVITVVCLPLTNAAGGIDTLMVSMPTEDALM
jgi:aryl-phospho-beta-D-glucosidase BglC (GH1 family)